MKVAERNVTRLVAVQHLRTAFGIKTKNWNKNKPAAGCKAATSNSPKVFGVSLESLPYYNMECGNVPSFLVDACMKLLAHVDTEGLFRKSGSVVRLKALRAKLDAGEEECLATALPCDVAGLVKQFFRELPEPVLPAELQEAFLKAQQLPAEEEERTSATMLLSCVLPDRNLTTLHYFFDFLCNVSKRSSENKMDSNNLSVILAPNLLHFGDGTEKMNAHTEKRLKLQAAIVHCFIENAHNFGVLPHFLQDKVPAMLGCEAGLLSPTHDALEELDLSSGMKKRHRRSFGDVVNGALNKIKSNRTPTNATQSDSLGRELFILESDNETHSNSNVNSHTQKIRSETTTKNPELSSKPDVFTTATPGIATPSSKRMLPLESGHSFGFSNKKRRSVKKNFGIDLLPNTLFSGTSTPGSAFSASVVSDTSQNILSPAGRSSKLSATSGRRKSRRLSNRHAVNRVESGRAGCFSPKASKKEAPRKSLRLRFSVGKSSKNAGSESIGWRLATQESATSVRCTKETEFSPSARPRAAESKGSKYISKSEDNLLTPHCDPRAHRTSWSGKASSAVAQALGGTSFTDTPMSVCLKSSCVSESAIGASKPPAGGSLHKKLCCASSAESLAGESSIGGAQSHTGPTLLKIKRAFTESGSDLQAVIRDSCDSTGAIAPQQAASVPVPPPGAPTVSVRSVDTRDASSFPAQQNLLADDQNITFGLFEIASLSPLHIDSVVFESGVYCSPPKKNNRASPLGSLDDSVVEERGRQAGQLNCSRLIDALDIHSPVVFKLGISSGLQSTPYKLAAELDDHELCTPSKIGAVVGLAHEKKKCFPETGSQIQNQQPPLSTHGPGAEKRRVVDHIQHFNKLTLHSPKGSRATQIRSPLKFQRTPVRQTVRRINSLLGDGRRPTGNSKLATSQSNRVAKALSLESGLSSHPQLQPHRGVAQAGPSTGVCPMKKPPPVPPKKPSTLARKPKACALGDVTNTVQPKTTVESSAPDPSGAQKPVQHVAEKEMNHYRGSPRNPLNHGRLLSATKPVDL